MTETPLRVARLIEAARFVLSRSTVRPPDLCEQFGVGRTTATQLIETLVQWHILSLRDNNSNPRLVLIAPVHEATVVSTLTWYSGIPPNPSPLEPLAHPGLTEQQRAVLDCIARGDEREATATALGRSPYTVKTHMANLRERFGARNNAHLVTLAHGYGLLPNPPKSTKDIS